MDHGLGIERRVMSDLIRLAKDLDLPLVATNDLHYTHAHDAKAHAALLCVQSGSTIDDPKRFKFDGEEFYLKSAAQMRQIFRDDIDADPGHRIGKCGPGLVLEGRLLVRGVGLLRLRRLCGLGEGRHSKERGGEHGASQ